MEFKYKAKNKEGKVIGGVMEATDTSELSRLLSEQKLYLIKSSRKTGRIALFKKVSAKERLLFCEQLGVMIGSGTSIIEGLEAIREETLNQFFSDIVNQVITDVKSGTSFSNSLKKHPKAFSDIFVNMMKSGEESGKLDLSLKRLTLQIENEYELNRKIKNALYYPAFILTALVIVLVLVMTYVIPQLTSIFNDSGVKLPFLTRMVIGVSHFFQSYILFIVIAIILLIFGLIRYRHSAKGRIATDRFLLKVPVFGTLLKKCYLSRFTRTFSSLSSSGLPLIEVFNVSGSTIGNKIYEEEVSGMAQKVQSGKSISSVFKASRNFPRIVGQMALVGERSGNIDQVFDKLADFFDRDVESLSGNISTMLEPILMVIIGVGIGIVIISVLQPIYGMVNVI